MSARGRGRGNAARPTDRSPSSSSASSRSSSVTNSTGAATAPTRHDDDLIQQLKKKLPGAGASTTRKFAPNLTVTKKEKTDPVVNADSPSSGSASTTNSRRGTNQQSRPNLPRGGRGGFNRGNFVQTEGFFEGTSQIPVAPSPSPSGSRSLSSNKRETSSTTLKMPMPKKMGPGRTTVLGDVDGLKYEIDDEYQPRQIPIGERRSVFDLKKEPDMLTKVKESISQSSEHIDSFVQLFAEQKLNPNRNSVVKDEPVELSEIPSTTTTTPMDPTQLILMQFPDVLPCLRPSSSNEKAQLASLTDLPDGFLGKLQIYKSGRCRLKLNDETYLDVDIGQSTSFLQNVMVTEMASTANHLNTDSSNTTTTTSSEMNKLVCLGDIKHKLIVSLDVDHVLEDTRQ